MSATVASQIELGHLDVFSMDEVYWVCGGLERHGDEWCRAGASKAYFGVAQSSRTGAWCSPRSGLACSSVVVVVVAVVVIGTTYSGYQSCK